MSTHKIPPRIDPVKCWSAALVSGQTTLLILVMRYSLTQTTIEERYSPSTAILLTELVKLIVSLAKVFGDSYQSRQAVNGNFILRALSICATGDCWLLAIPAAFYTLQNSLQYIAVSHLDVATFQVTNQLKILSTAFFSVVILRRRLAAGHWIALVLLTMGVGVTQVSRTSIANMGRAFLTESSLSAVLGDSETRLGLVAVGGACAISGLAGVYFEKVLKGGSQTLWVRNVQLSFFSLFPSLFLGVLSQDGERVHEKGFFYGYNLIVWAVIMLQALGGIAVAICVAYTDNITKNFATSISILVSCIASVYIFDTHLSSNFITGAMLVLYATYLYSTLPSPRRICGPSLDSSQSKVEKHESKVVAIAELV